MFFIHALLLTMFASLNLSANVSSTLYRVETLSQLVDAAHNSRRIHIVSDINLKGCEINLSHCRYFEVEGRLTNGVIIGNRTKIESVKEDCFDNVHFRGTFKGEPNISWFHIEYNREVDNSTNLNSALELASCSSIKHLSLLNKSVIYVRSDVDDSKWRDFLRKGTVEIPSGVVFDLNESVIRCLPNGSHQYNILFSRNTQDIVIRNGKIQGDMNDHKGVNGEWGYGIELQGVKGFLLENLECCDCWGDGIDIQVSSDGDGIEWSTKTQKGHCKEGVIKNVYCHNNRRQGMSVQGIIGLKVEGSRFSRSHGTNPQCGVDIEPYTENNIVTHVIFDKCEFDNNVNSGILLFGNSISDVRIKNCSFSDNSGWDISLQGKSLNVANCFGPEGDSSPSIRILGNSENVLIKNCCLQTIIAQSFTKGSGVNSVRVEECKFTWNGKKTAHGFSDDNSLMTCDMFFLKCIFDFNTGTFTDGNMVYQSHDNGYHYTYNNCTFNLGGELLRFNGSQSFYNCLFSDCGGLFTVLAPTAINTITFEKCKVTSNNDNGVISLYSPDEATIEANLRQTRIQNKNNQLIPVIVKSNRPVRMMINSKARNILRPSSASITINQ